MFKNNVNPIPIFGLAITAFASFMGAILFDIVNKSYTTAIEYWHIEMIVIVLFAVVSGLGLIFRWKFARHTTTLLLVLAGLAYGIFLYSESGSGGDFFIILGLSACIYGLLAFGVLFVNNHSILPFFDEDIFMVEKEDFSEILDK
ncbi:MAG: hypothetical protein AAFV95_06505 [Bacteroidota bacterium]